MHRVFESIVAATLAARATLLRSARAFGTPQYVLDEPATRQRTRRLARAFPDAHIFYALKSNDLPALVRVFQSEGLHADVASGFELQLALALGFERIIYTAPMKRDEDLRLAMRNDVVINVDNDDELSRIAALGRARISLRINTGGAWSKFGFDDPAAAITRALALPKLRLEGLHAHASWNTTPVHHVANLQRLCKLAARAPGLRFLDVGGGFLPEWANETKRGRIKLYTRSTIEDFGQALAAVPIPAGLELWIEPGRWLSAPSTLLLARVSSTRKTGVITDCGTNLVGEMTFRSQFVPILNLSRPSRAIQSATVYGPMCDPDDLWGSRYQGEPARTGDVLAILLQGAYSFASAWRWQQPTAAYVVRNGRRLAVVKQRESFAQRYAGCRWPPARWQRT